jgi:hypothetical protein
LSAADSWYHEKEAACWRRLDPAIPDDFTPGLRARVGAGDLPAVLAFLGAGSG